MLSWVKMASWKKSWRTWKIQFLKYLFPWSDQLYQKRVLKLSKILDGIPSKQSVKIDISFQFVAAK